MRVRMMKLLDAPRQPFIGLALAAALGITIGDFAPVHANWFGGVLLVMALVALLRQNTPATYAFVAASFFFLHSLRVTESPGLQLARNLGERPRAASARGSIVSEPKIAANGFASFLLQLESVEFAGKRETSHATLFVRWRGTANFGDELQLFGMAEPIAPPRNPGELDMRSYLARRDVRRELFVRYAEDGVLLNQAGGNPILRAAQKSRAWMQRVLCRGLDDSPDVEGLISGMVLGLRHQTPEDIEEPFQQTGTLHLFAVAGLHVGIVARLLWILAIVAQLPRKWAAWLIIPALFFYATITGLHTSSVRAALMSAVLLGGFLIERKVFALNSLAAAAALILVWDTNELFSVGFQLSFAVVAGIILLTEPFFRLSRRWFEADRFLPRSLFSRARRVANRTLWWISRAASVSAAAWVGSLPLMLWHYHLVTPISLLANLVVIPIAFFVLAGGMLSMIAAPISSSLSLIFNNANWVLARLVLGVVHLFAQWPGGHFYAERPHWPNGAHAAITVLDLGAGAAVHVRTRERDWLFDSGGERDFERVVRDYLRSRGINRLNGLLLSHGDAAHIGGASAVVQNFRPRTIIDTGAHDRSHVHHALIAEFAERKIPRSLHAADDEIKLSREVTARIIFPPRNFGASIADDQTIIAQLIVDGKPRVLFMSDSGEPTERTLLEHATSLRSDILVKGQHHSGISGSAEFLDAVRPLVIVATSRGFPQSERIPDDWAEMVRSRGIKLLRQDETGAVELNFFRNHWEATSYLTRETFRSASR
jgi:competence protein ComEC